MSQEYEIYIANLFDFSIYYIITKVAVMERKNRFICYEVSISNNCNPNYYFIIKRTFHTFGQVADFAISRDVIEKIYNLLESMDGSGPDQV